MHDLHRRFKSRHRGRVLASLEQRGRIQQRGMFEEYKIARRATRKTTRSPEVSPTRRIINKVVEGASPTRCLETNLFATPTVSIAKLSAANRSTAPIELLLRSIKPRVLLFHGSGHSHLRKIGIYDTPDENEFPLSSTPFGPMYVGVVRHFSRGWSYKDASKLGLKLLDYSTRPLPCP